MAGAPPLILVVDDDDERRVRVRDELEHRYAADYRIAAVPMASAAAELEGAAGRDEPVALVLAGLPPQSCFLVWEAFIRPRSGHS